MDAVVQQIAVCVCASQDHDNSPIPGTMKSFLRWFLTISSHREFRQALPALLCAKR
jgi:hypothetical protein